MLCLPNVGNNCFVGLWQGVGGTNKNIKSTAEAVRHYCDTAVVKMHNLTQYNLHTFALVGFLSQKESV